MNLSLSTGLAQLQTGLKNTRLRLDATRVGWSDVTRNDFEDNYWGPLEEQTIAVIRKMEHVAQVLTQMQQETG